MGHAGIVLGLEVSRLARNSIDWHRLLEICALSETLILDEDGLYNPTDYNDRLLLGLKGTMSEAELHMLRARMRGGLLAKARRGELRIGLPVGLVYDPLDRVVLHPDAQVQDTLHLFFQTFFRTGAAGATVRHFSEHHIPFPAPARSNMAAEVLWGRLSLRRAVNMLHNPRYAGAFAYGRRNSRKQPDGHHRITVMPRDEWHVLLLDAHAGYISWEDYERIDPEISHRDRKRIMALLVADVTLTKKHEQIAIGVRFRGGGTTNPVHPPPSERLAQASDPSQGARTGRDAPRNAHGHRRGDPAQRGGVHDRRRCALRRRRSPLAPPALGAQELPRPLARRWTSHNHRDGNSPGHQRKPDQAGASLWPPTRVEIQWQGRLPLRTDRTATPMHPSTSRVQGYRHCGSPICHTCCGRCSMNDAPLRSTRLVLLLGVLLITYIPALTTTLPGWFR